jgi:hypothetical protein
VVDEHSTVVGLVDVLAPRADCEIGVSVAIDVTDARDASTEAPAGLVGRVFESDVRRGEHALCANVA